MASARPLSDPTGIAISIPGSTGVLTLKSVFDPPSRIASEAGHWAQDDDNGCDCNCHCYCADDLVTLAAGMAVGAAASVPKTVVIR